MVDDYEGAKKEAMLMDDIFGHGNFFLEMQDQGIEEELKVNRYLMQLSKELDIGLVATNDVHYVRREDAEIHDLLLAIQTQSTIDDPERMRFPNDQFYLKSEDEMRKLFAFAPEAIENTSRIAERCNVEITFGEYHLPEFVPPEGLTNYEYLRKLCYEGLEDRYGDEVTDYLKERMEYEIGVINTMGYVEYFLIVWDFINFAKRNGIMVGPGRGSAAGSLVAYCLKITDIDPIKYNLIFERFLNPERVSMPDIDVDFCIERRGEVIDYVKEKYGTENVSQIVTFGRLTARAAIRAVARALNVPIPDTNKIATQIPAMLNITIDKALEINPDLKEMYENDPVVARVIDMAKGIEGNPNHTSTHAAGVVISKRPLDEYVPLIVRDGAVATQFTMGTLENLGLLKMDFLGLRNLTVIRDALAMIKESTGEDIDISAIDMEDPEIYKIISEGNTDGIFQLESIGMTNFMLGLKPTCFEDIVAGISLFRPGPMDSIPDYIENKKDPSRITYVTPELKPILDVTYGCLVYQEQVMEIVRTLAGYSYGSADLIRRAMAKKKQAEMQKQRDFFINGIVDEEGNIEIPGCLRNGISKEAAETIFSDMETFAEYAFNKSHAAAYAVIACQTAWLKRYHPVQFMAALMSSIMSEKTMLSRYIRNCREMGIEILPPSVNSSMTAFSVEGDKIRIGLMGVKNVGEGAAEAIIEARERNGIPKDIFAMIQGLDITRVNKKAIESLIKAGAFDCIDENRAALLSVYETALESAQSTAKKNLEGQISLFDISAETMNEGVTHMAMPDIANFDKDVLLMMEKEMVGVYITDHPLNRYEKVIKEFSTVNSLQLAEPEINNGQVKDKDLVVMGGIIDSVRERYTRNGDRMANVDLEDFYTVTELIVFPRAYGRLRSQLVEDSRVFVKGRVSFDENQKGTIFVDEIIPMNQAEERREDLDISREKNYNSYQKPSEPERPVRNQVPERPVKIKLPAEGEESELLDDIGRVMKEHRGRIPVLIYLRSGKILGTPSGGGVRPTVEFAEAIADIVGNANIKIEEIAR